MWVSRFLTAQFGYTVLFTLDVLEITENTQTKYNSEKAKSTTYHKTKLSRLLRHLARKRDGLILQRSWANMGEGEYGMGGRVREGAKAKGWEGCARTFSNYWICPWSWLSVEQRTNSLQSVVRSILKVLRLLQIMQLVKYYVQYYVGCIKWVLTCSFFPRDASYASALFHSHDPYYKVKVAQWESFMSKLCVIESERQTCKISRRNKV